MQVMIRDGIKIYIGVDGDEQMTSCMNGTQTVYYGSAFRSTEGMSVSVSLTPIIPHELIESGDTEAIAEYLISIFQKIKELCEVEIYIGPNCDVQKDE